MLFFQQTRRRARSWPFDSVATAVCTIFCAFSDAPISVANGHDLDPLRAWSQIRRAALRRVRSRSRCCSASIRMQRNSCSTFPTGARQIAFGRCKNLCFCFGSGKVLSKTHRKTTRQTPATTWYAYSFPWFWLGSGHAHTRIRDPLS